MTVTVTFTDRPMHKETFSCYDARAGDGVLWILQRMHSGQPKRCIPLVNLRLIEIEGE